jgi:hypothetical protein
MGTLNRRTSTCEYKYESSHLFGHIHIRKYHCENVCCHNAFTPNAVLRPNKWVAMASGGNAGAGAYGYELELDDSEQVWPCSAVGMP